jgi:hypothetical protein
MSPFKLDRAQTHFGFAFEFGSKRSEDQNEGRKMEVDSMVTSKPQSTKLEVTFNIGILLVLQMVPMKSKVLTSSSCYAC